MTREDRTEHSIQHHTKYKEIHGYDEIVEMSWGDHQKLHREMRVEGKCDIPSKELKKISTAASNRSKKTILQKREYHKAKIRSINFDEEMLKGVWHREMIRYNEQTGAVYINGLFSASGGKKIKYIGEN